MTTKLKVTGTFILTHLNGGKRDIIDAEVLEGKFLLIGDKFISENGLTFEIQSIGMSGTWERTNFPLTIKKDPETPISDFMDIVFTKIEE